MRRYATSGEAVVGSFCDRPLPRLRGSSGEADEGVFPLRSALVPTLVTQKLSSRTVTTDPGSFGAKSMEAPALCYRFGGVDSGDGTRSTSCARVRIGMRT